WYESAGDLPSNVFAFCRHVARASDLHDSGNVSVSELGVHFTAHYRQTNGFLDGDENELENGEQTLVSRLWIGCYRGASLSWRRTVVLYRDTVHRSDWRVRDDVCV